MFSFIFDRIVFRRAPAGLLLMTGLLLTLACAPSDPAPDAATDTSSAAPPVEAVDPAVTAAAVLEMLAGPADFQAQAITLDPSRVRPGAVLYQMILNGQPLGSTTAEIQVGEDEVTIREITSVPEVGFLQQTQARLGADHAMRGVTSQGQLGAGAAVNVDLSWQDGRLSGHSDFPRQEGYPQGKVDFDHELDASIPERTVLVHLIGALDLEVGAETPLRVFNAFEGRVRGRTVRVVGEEEITVPAGTFQTLRVEIDGGEPSHILWVATDAPRRVVKMELVGHPWIYEMVPPPAPDGADGDSDGDSHPGSDGDSDPGGEAADG